MFVTFDPPAARGWLCPACGSAHAPSVQTCPSTPAAAPTPAGVPLPPEMIIRQPHLMRIVDELDAWVASAEVIQ